MIEPGQTFGRLVIRDRVMRPRARAPDGSQQTFWTCECVCGNVKTVRADSLRDGVTRSCGCLAFEARRDVSSKAAQAAARAKGIAARKVRSLDPEVFKTSAFLTAMRRDAMTGRELAQMRALHGLTRTTVAVWVGVSGARVTQWETPTRAQVGLPKAASVILRMMHHELMAAAFR